MTYAVNKTGDSDTDASIAQRLSNSISVVTKTGDFKDRLFADVEEENVNPNYVISSAYTDNSNLFSVTVTANNYNNANMLLDLLENMYPEWVAGSNGTMELQVVDRALAGENPVNGYSAMKQLVEGVLAGVILCLAIAALYSQLIRTVRKESDMKKITSKGCISLIPEIAVKKREKSVWTGDLSSLCRRLSFVSRNRWNRNINRFYSFPVRFRRKERVWRQSIWHWHLCSMRKRQF